MGNVAKSWILAALITSVHAQNVEDTFSPENFAKPQEPDKIFLKLDNPSFNFKTGVGRISPFSLKTKSGLLVEARESSFTLATPSDYQSIKASLNGQVSLIHPPQGKEYGVQIFSDRAIVDAPNQTVTLEGNVSLFTGDALHRGDKTVYHYGTRKIDTSGMRSGIDPIFLESGKFRSSFIEGRKVFIGENARLTTHDVINPDYWIRADKTVVYPGDKVTFRNLKVQVGDVPVFWLPYLSQPLDAELGYRFIPGARSNWGPFLLNRYGIMLGGEYNPETGENKGASVLSQWHFDILSRRGVGLGLDLKDPDYKKNENLSGFSFYHIKDGNPTERRSGIPRGLLNDDRYILRLKQKADLGRLSGFDLEAFADLNKISDRFYLEDFQPRLFRTNPEPDNILGLSARNDESLITLFARLPLNNFYQSDSRLPELSFDQVRGPLFGSSILHEGQTSLGIYRETLADFNENSLRAEAATLLPGDPRLAAINTLLASRGFHRFHTYQELSLPTNFGNWLNITPRVGFGHTAYGDIDGPGNSTSSTTISAGVDVSTKFSRTYDDIHSEKWGLDGIKHVVQPYTSASWLRTNELDSSFGRIDRLTASTRPRERSVGRFSAIDELADWGVFRLGVRNQLLTKRDEGTHEWLLLDTYIDAFSDDPELDRSFSNLYNDLIWQPVPWSRLNFDTQFPIVEGGSGFSEVVTSVTFMPNDTWEFSIGHRYLNNHPILLDSNQVEFRSFARINDLWGFDFLHRWELDDSTLEVQQYNIHYDLDSWIISAGLNLRDNRSVNEYAFLLSFTLKDFPDVELPISIDTE